jgi:hypothetical protein
VFEALKSVMAKHASSRVVAVDKPDNSLLNTHYSERRKKELMFGAGQRKKLRQLSLDAGLHVP